MLSVSPPRGRAGRAVSAGRRPPASAGAEGIVTLSWLSVSGFCFVSFFFFSFFARASSVSWLRLIRSGGEHCIYRLGVDRLNLMATARPVSPSDRHVWFWVGFFFGCFIFDSGCQDSEALESADKAREQRRHSFVWSFVIQWKSEGRSQ